jgi:hypothetical protein
MLLAAASVIDSKPLPTADSNRSATTPSVALCKTVIGRWNMNDSALAFSSATRLSAHTPFTNSQR